MKNRVSQELLHVTDWFPTILSLAGGDVKSVSKKQDGKNVWKTLSKGEPSPRNELLLNIDNLVYHNSAMRQGKWKIIFQKREYVSVLLLYHNITYHTITYHSLRYHIIP